MERPDVTVPPKEPAFLHDEAPLMLGRDVACLDDSTVLALVSGRLGGADLTAADAHLDACADCRALLVTFARGAGAGAGGDAAADAAEVGVLRPGAAVGRYIVDGLAGDGAMGVVYTASDPTLGRRVAIKLLRATDQPDQGKERDRLLREAQAMARLAHPNVVTVHEVGTAHGRVFLAMELVQGRSLRAWMSEPRAWQDVVAVMEQVGRGLAAAHAAGLVHRDVKPDNILVGDDGRARACDFGLACGPEGGEVDVASPADVPVARTVTGALAGTPAYMAPEALRGRGADARADQFSFCATFFEALHGERPFTGRDVAELRDAIERGHIAAPAARAAGPHAAVERGHIAAPAAQAVALREAIGRGPIAAPAARAAEPRAATVRGSLAAPRRRAAARVPAWLDALVRRGLAARPEERFPSMTALLAALAHGRARHERRWIRAAIACAVIIGGAAGVLAIRPFWTTAPACDAGAARAATVWNSAARAGVSAAITKSAPSDAGPAIDALDRWATSFAAAHDETCRATHARGEQSALLLDLRMRCLERRRREAAVLVERLSRGADIPARRAVDAVTSLPDPAECRDLDAAGVDPFPRDPEASAAAEQALSGLDDARAALFVGDHRQALALLQAPAEAAARSGHAPTRAEVDLVRAEALRMSGDRWSAEEAAQASLWSAERGHDDIGAVRAWLLLVALAGERRDLAAALERANHAEAALARAGNPAVFTARLDHARGLIAESAGHLDQAERHLTAALQRRRALRGDDDIEVARTLAALGGVARASGRLDEAREKIGAALAIDERRLGPDHPDVARDLHNLGGVLRLTPDLDGALRHYTRALAIRRSAFGEDHVDTALTHNSIGLVHMARGRIDDAERELTAALAVLSRLGHPDRAIAQHNLALVAQQRGDHPAALRLFAEAESVYRATLGESAEPLRRLRADRAASERPLPAASVTSPAPPRSVPPAAPPTQPPANSGMYGAPRPWDRN